MVKLRTCRAYQERQGADSKMERVRPSEPPRDKHCPKRPHINLPVRRTLGPLVSSRLLRKELRAALPRALEQRGSAKPSSSLVGVAKDMCSDDGNKDGEIYRED
jgi:hypothetical protein